MPHQNHTLVELFETKNRRFQVYAEQQRAKDIAGYHLVQGGEVRFLNPRAECGPFVSSHELVSIGASALQ